MRRGVELVESRLKAGTGEELCQIEVESNNTKADKISMTQPPIIRRDNGIRETSQSPRVESKGSDYPFRASSVSVPSASLSVILCCASNK